MMVQIQPTSGIAKKRAARQALVDAKADEAITQIDSDIVTLDSSPSNAEVIAIVKRTLQRQRRIIKYLANLE